MLQPDDRQLKIGVGHDDGNGLRITELYTIEAPYYSNVIKIKCLKGAAFVLLKRAPSNTIQTVPPPTAELSNNNNLENTNDNGTGGDGIADTEQLTQEHANAAGLSTRDGSQQRSPSSDASIYSATTIQSSSSAAASQLETPVRTTTTNNNPRPTIHLTTDTAADLFTNETQTGLTQPPSVNNAVTNAQLTAASETQRSNNNDNVVNVDLDETPDSLPTPRMTQELNIRINHLKFCAERQKTAVRPPTTNNVATVNPMGHPSTSALLPANGTNNNNKRRRETNNDDSDDSSEGGGADEENQENRPPPSKVPRISTCSLLRAELLRVLIRKPNPQVLIGTEPAKKLTCIPITLPLARHILIDKPNYAHKYNQCKHATENGDANLFMSSNGIHLIPKTP